MGGEDLEQRVAHLERSVKLLTDLCRALTGLQFMQRVLLYDRLGLPLPPAEDTEAITQLIQAIREENGR